MAKRRKRFGDRKDGRKLRTLNSMLIVEPFIMKSRNDALNYISDSIDMTRLSKYVNEKKKAGFPGFSAMHVIIAAYVRCVSQRPAVNRFVAGQKLFARNEIVIALDIKKEMTLESPDTVVKVVLKPDATVDDVYYAFEKVVREYRDNPGGSFDKTARIISKIPGVIGAIAVGLIRIGDYFGLLPKKLTDLSPFHASMFITSMGSLGIPPIYHHLYNLGNVPVFISFGKKRIQNELQDDGTVKRVPYLDLKFVMDERICDGYYFASAWKYIRLLLKNPAVLEEKPEAVVEDID